MCATNEQRRESRPAAILRFLPRRLLPLAIVFGVLSGMLQIFVADPLFTALAVLVFTMILGTARPRRPWHWVLLVDLPVPLTMMVAQLIQPLLHYTRASIAGSVLIILPGVAGAYGGYVMRRMVREIYGNAE